MDNKIKEKHLSRIAYVYIRQSTQYQAENNLESQRRQYQLVDKAKAMGFNDVRVIDEDMGISAGGYAERGGFKKLVSEVGLNKVGIIFGLEVSRFARNNRDWYYLMDLCSLFDTLIADQDGIYNCGHPNDRMVLGLKGTMSEVEINILKGRMLEGARNKAKRGELIYRLPIGFVKTDDQKIEKDPDKMIQKVIETVFTKFRESGSIRQTLLWFVQEKISFPGIEYNRSGKEVIWKVPVYNTIYHVLKNPAYAGAYAYGRREQRKRLDGNDIRKRKVNLEMKDWQVLIKDNHPGYISWEEYKTNQNIIQENEKKMGSSRRGAILKGNGLLAGLLRCKRCGRKLAVAYGGKKGKVPQYDCSAARLSRGEKACIAFGGMRVDEAISREVLKVVEPFAIKASFQAVEEFNAGIEEHRRLIQLELEKAEYEAERAYRQYNKVEPENRLVSAQLESNWNRRLEGVERIKERLQPIALGIQSLSEKEKQEILSLSEDLPQLWNSPKTTNEIRKRIIRTAIEEIVADVNSEKTLVLLDIHWVGGVHTTLHVKKNKTGQHRNCTDESTIELVRQLAKQLSDKAIAPLLNRLRVKTGNGNNWTRDRVRVLRQYHNIPVHTGKKETDIITIEQASEKLGICAQSVRMLIKSKVISAKQVVPCAPWAILTQELEKDIVKKAVERIKSGQNRKKDPSWHEGQEKFFQ